MVELLVVVAIIAIGAGLSVLALRDPSEARLEREAERLAALLEAARAEARASAVPARWVTTDGGFRFAGLPPRVDLPERWLGADISAQILGARAVVLGPEPLIGAQRIVLRHGERSIAVATDGLAPFAVEVPGGRP